MIKRIILCVVLSFLLACLLTVTGFLGIVFRPLDLILELGSLLCHNFLSSHFAGDMEGNMITAVIWLNLAVYTSLRFPVLMYTRTWVRSRGDAKP
jgi:hypothetical protein